MFHLLSLPSFFFCQFSYCSLFSLSVYLIILFFSVISLPKEYDTKLTRDIMELLDREEDLIKRGVRPENLDGVFVCPFLWLFYFSQYFASSLPPSPIKGLRKRTLNLFLLFCETPQYNPQAARVVKVCMLVLYIYIYIFIYMHTIGKRRLSFMSFPLAYLYWISIYWSQSNALCLV